MPAAARWLRLPLNFSADDPAKRHITTHDHGGSLRDLLRGVYGRERLNNRANAVV